MESSRRRRGRASLDPGRLVWPTPLFRFTPITVSMASPLIAKVGASLEARSVLPRDRLVSLSLYGEACSGDRGASRLWIMTAPRIIRNRPGSADHGLLRLQLNHNPAGVDQRGR